MIGLLQVVTVMVVALPTALSVAHALELPGKMRLDEQTYRAVQRIYYPGFTMGGIAEVPAVIVTGVLLFLMPAGTLSFWLVLIALLGMIMVVAIYWIAVHPVNKYWMAGETVSGSAASFFAAGAKHKASPHPWMQLRDRWEYSHLARAVLSSVSQLALVISLVVY